MKDTSVSEDLEVVKRNAYGV